MAEMSITLPRGRDTRDGEKICRPARIAYTMKVQKQRIKSHCDNRVIPYGRQAASIAAQIESDTGLVTPVAEIEQVLWSWKNVTFTKAWALMLQCQKDATGQGFVESVWGRRRYFVMDGNPATRASAERESQNFPYRIGELKPSEFGGSHLCLQLVYIQCTVAKVIPSQAQQECCEGVTTSGWSPERTVNRHERPAQRKLVMI